MSFESAGDSRPTRRQVLRSSAAVMAVAGGWIAARGDDKPSTTAEKPSSGPKRHPLLVTQNPVISRARDEALEVLKPTAAQLERGLELHTNSVVFDTYGFAPTAAIDGAAFQTIAEQGAFEAELNDLREEMTRTQAVWSDAEREEFREALRCGGVTCIFQNAGEEGQDPLMLMKRLARCTFLTDMLRGTLTRASLPQDIEAAKREGLHCLYLTGNGVPILQRWETVEQELGYVRLFFQLGIRMMHVTYNRRNMLGDGCAEIANGGLSDFGREAVAEMNRVGVIVDVAHSGWRTSLESAKASTRPMVASHTTCDELNHHIRAKPDEVIKAICDTGGLIGICCIPNFLGRTGDIAALIDHIDHAVKKYGVEHVGIGTDVAHVSQNAGAQNALVKSRGKRRERFASLWPEGALGGNWPGRRTLAWTNWPLFTVGLVQRGYSDDDIAAILGGNMLRVCREVLPEPLATLS